MVTEISIDVSQMIDFGQGLMVSERVVAEETRKALERSAILVQNDAKRNLQAHKAIDTSQLINSIAREVTPTEAQIGSNKAHARLVEGADEQGNLHEWSRRPEMPMPPKGSLLGWMNRHGIPAEAEFVIRRAIARDGIPARPYLIPALESNRRNIEREFAAAADRINKRLVP